MREHYVVEMLVDGTVSQAWTATTFKVAWRGWNDLRRRIEATSTGRHIGCAGGTDVWETPVERHLIAARLRPIFDSGGE
jgi:hypothetical protein